MKNVFAQYRKKIETVPPDDGGGIRIYYPTLGFSVYGVGDTLEEAMASLQESEAALIRFRESTPEYVMPSPTSDDLSTACRATIANNNFAYAS